MAATVVPLGVHNVGGLEMHHFKLTADGITAEHTLTGNLNIKGISFPFKTTGSAGAVAAVYVESTGVITWSTIANLDVIYYTVMI